MWVKPYKYKIPRAKQPDRLDRLEPIPNDEGLTGLVQGQRASDLEERFARALYKLKLRFWFQFYVYTAYSLPGEDKVVDFVVDAGLMWPLEVDASFTHKTSEQRQYDKIRDAQVDEALGRAGYQRIQRIPGEKLATQDLANQKAADLF